MPYSVMAEIELPVTHGATVRQLTGDKFINNDNYGDIREKKLAWHGLGYRLAGWERGKHPYQMKELIQ